MRGTRDVNLRVKRQEMYIHNSGLRCVCVFVYARMCSSEKCVYYVNYVVSVCIGVSQRECPCSTCGGYVECVWRVEGTHRERWRVTLCVRTLAWSQDVYTAQLCPCLCRAEAFGGARKPRKRLLKTLSPQTSLTITQGNQRRQGAVWKFQSPHAHTHINIGHQNFSLKPF